MKHVLDWSVYGNIARQAVAEGCVLLRNEGGTLPIHKDQRVSVFGRIQLDYFKSGTGSGGLVNAPYVEDILGGLRLSGIPLNEELVDVYKQWTKKNSFDLGNGWAQEPWSQEEMPLTKDLVDEASSSSDIALVIIGRTAGEDRDNTPTPGSYLLTEQEETMIKMVCEGFDQMAVLLNVGNIMDMSWVEKYKPGAVLYCWQGGCEGGNGVADVLIGKVNPCGKLSDTIAYKLSDYPCYDHFGHEKSNTYVEDIYVGYRYFETFAKEQVMYPFGFGLSYTNFDIEMVHFSHGDDITVQVKVTNCGKCAGKEVVQLYGAPPQGTLGKPARNLIAFQKTQVLQPQESQTLSFNVGLEQLASYDDCGYTGHPYCYVLEPGTYEFYLGNSVRDTICIGSVKRQTLQVVTQLSQALAPTKAYKRLRASVNEEGTLRESYEDAPIRQNYSAFSKDCLLEDVPYTGDKGYSLMDVYRNAVTMDTFLAQLKDEDLICMSRGEGMCSPKVTPGTAGSFGGVTDTLASFGIPIACCADGPSGIRMDNGAMAFSLPNGTSLACTFNEELCKKLFEMEALELRVNKVDTLLGPGMNIHRHPLNGRNFEYFSEDPLLTGKMAVAQLKGLHKHGVTGTIKHFACNNQEYSRTEANALVSERALREIYLKGFEIAVKEGAAHSIMTTYGPINDIYTAGNYDLLTTILRGEWGYDGIVMTDWWAKVNEEGQDGSRQNTATMIKAQNDLYMVVNDAKNNSHDDNSEKGLTKGVFERKHLIRNAKNICSFLMKVPTFLYFYKEQGMSIEELHRPVPREEHTVFLPDIEPTKEGVLVKVDDITTLKGNSVKWNVRATGMSKFAIDFHLSASVVGVAQIPMTVYLNNQVLQTLILNESNCEQAHFTVEYTTFMSLNSYIKLYFGESGMQIHSIKVRKIG